VPLDVSQDAEPSCVRIGIVVLAKEPETAIPVLVHEAADLRHHRIGLRIHDGLHRSKGRDPSQLREDRQPPGRLRHADSPGAVREVADFLGVGALGQVALDLGPLNLVRFRDGAVEYETRAVRDGVEYSFAVIFVIDDDGIWRISAF
jgi:hypothetical protein